MIIIMIYLMARHHAGPFLALIRLRSRDLQLHGNAKDKVQLYLEVSVKDKLLGNLSSIHQ